MPTQTTHKIDRELKINNIGSLSSLAKLLEYSCIFVMNKFTGPHEKQPGNSLKSFSAVWVAVFVLIFSPGILSTPSHAGILNYYPTSAPKDNFVDFEYAKKIWLEADTREKFFKEADKYSDIADPWIAKEIASERMHHSKVREYRKWSDKDPVAFAKKRGHDMQMLLDYFSDNLFGNWMVDYQRGNTNKSFSQLMKEHQKGTCKGIKKPGDHINWARRYISNGQLIHCEQWPDWRDKKYFELEKEVLAKYKGAYAKKQGKLNARKIEVQKQNQILKKQFGFTK